MTKVYATLKINQHATHIHSKTLHTLLKDNLIHEPKEQAQHQRNRHTLQTILGYLLQRRLLPHEDKLTLHYINKEYTWDINPEKAEQTLQTILTQITDLDKTHIQYKPNKEQ